MTVGAVKRVEAYDQLYPGRFLKAGLFLGKKVTLTITDIFLEAMPDDRTGGEKERGIVSFKQTHMQLALNRTNGECLKAMFGKSVKNWIGKNVTFVSEPDKFGKEDVDSIRIVGSPELEKTLEIEIKMPKRKAKKRTLVRTGAKDSGSVAQPEPEPVQQSKSQEEIEAEAAERALAAQQETA